jgi:hypothetical protein
MGSSAGSTVKFRTAYASLHHASLTDTDTEHVPGPTTNTVAPSFTHTSLGAATHVITAPATAVAEGENAAPLST